MAGQNGQMTMEGAMSWSIAQVARMSGVTSRTLRHYGEIGLLRPAYVGGNGYRYYEEEQLLRLQQILVLRELDVGLGEIAEALDSEPDTVAALHRHYAKLLAERDRIGRLAETVAHTIAELEHGGDQVATPKINRPENLFAGFDPSAYEAEARERWPEQYEQSKAVADGFTPEQAEAEQREMTAHMIRMAELMVAGASAGPGRSTRRWARPAAASCARSPAGSRGRARVPPSPAGTPGSARSPRPPRTVPPCRRRWCRRARSAGPAGAPPSAGGSARRRGAPPGHGRSPPRTRAGPHAA